MGIKAVNRKTGKIIRAVPKKKTKVKMKKKYIPKSYRNVA